MANKATFGELGYTGLVEFSGQISEDFLRELRGKEAYKRFDEMRRNSPIVAALLLADEQAIRKVSWEFTSDEGEEDPRLELLEAARDNMSVSWNDFVTEVLTMLPFGFSLFEIVYERVGAQVLWRKFAPRGQDTVYQWKFDEHGGPAAVVQMAAPRYQLVELPIEKLLLFRTRVERGNPEGRSILRSAWIPYYYAKHIQQIEAIGIERDLAGLPKIKLPQGADTSDNDSSDYGKASQMVRNVRNDEQAGIVLPDGWEFELVSTGGSRQFDTDKIVRRYESRMLMSALAQFIMLGQDGVGSLALSSDMSDFFTMAINATADIISDTFTKYAIPRLLALNGYDAEGVYLTHSPAGDVDTTAVADFLQKVGGYITWNADDELWLRQLIGLPERDTQELQAERDGVQAAKEQAAAALAQSLKGKQEQPADKQPSDKQPAEDMPEEKMTIFSANAPDDEQRRKFERKLQKLVAARLQGLERRVLKAAKEYRA